MIVKQLNKWWAGQVLLGILTLSVLGACGKVVQEVSKEDPPKSFNVSFDVGPVSNTPFRSSTLSNDQWDTSQSVVYAQISGVDKRAYTELSWGRSVLDSKTVTAQATTGARPAVRSAEAAPTTTVYESVSYRKSGLKLTGASDHTWTKIEYSAKPKTWQITSNKIKRGYPYYRVSFYSGKDHVLFKLLDEKTVSSSAMVAVGRLDNYDVFIGVLGSMIFKDRPEYLDRDDTLRLLGQLFPRAFFSSLNYKPPKNSVKTFVPDRPSWTMNGPFERELIKWFFLFDEDIRAAKDYIESYQAPWFTKAIRKQFDGIVDAFEASQSLSD